MLWVSNQHKNGLVSWKDNQQLSRYISQNTRVFIASPQTSFGVRSSRIQKWMRDERTLKDICGEARVFINFCDVWFLDDTVGEKQ